MNLIDRTIAERTANAHALAARFGDLAELCQTGTVEDAYGRFVEACLDRGLQLDFITSCEMFETLRDAATGPEPTP